MKNYEETIESVFKRSNAIIKKRAERRRTTRLITSVLSCFLFVAFLGVGALNGVFNRILFEKPDRGILQYQPTESNGTQSNQNAHSETPSSGDTQGDSNNKFLVSPDDPSIVWAEKMSRDNGMGDWNGKQIGDGLYEALSHYSGDTVFAIVVQAIVGNKQEYSRFVYNGKTLAEYEKAAEEESNLSEKLALLLECGDDLKYGEALYKVGNGKGQKWVKDHYDSEIAYFGDELLSKYIVNGEFLREKLEYDCSQPVTVTSRIAWYKAYDAYENYIIQQTKEQFAEQGIVFECKNAVYHVYVAKYPLDGDLTSEDAYISIERNKAYLITYISKEKFSSLTGNYEFNVFNLADKNAHDGIFPFGPSDA